MTVGLFLLLGMGLVYSPRLFNWDEEPMHGIEYWVSGSYLGKWIWFGFPLLTIGLIIPLLIFTQGSVIFMTAMAFLNGAFACLTGIIPIPMRRSYGYIHDRNARRVGLVQFLLAAICLVIFFHYFYEPLAK